MNTRRRCWNCLAPAIVVALLLTTVRGEIPPEVIIASGALSPRQQQALDEDASKLVEQLIKGSDADVVKARSELLDPFDKAPKDRAFFKIAYSGSVAHALFDAGAMKSPRLIVRLNTMIIVAQLFDAAAIKLIDMGLADANPAVRYWGAKAAGQLAQAKSDEDHWLLAAAATERASLTPSRHRRPRSPSPDALQQELKSLQWGGSMSLTRSLGSLPPLIPASPSTPPIQTSRMTADTGGLHELYVDQVQQAIEAAVDPAAMRKLVLVSYRYLALIAQQLVDGKPSPEIEAQYWEMLKICNVALPWAAEKVAPSFVPPGDLKTFIDTHDKLGIQLRSADWKQAAAEGQAPVHARRTGRGG